MGSFQAWVETVGGILHLVGLTNFLDNLSDIHKGDFRRRFGKALSFRLGSQFDESGLHLIKAATDRRSGSTYWKVADMQISQI